MNVVVAMGRLTKEPECRYTGENQTAVTTYTLAVDRRRRDDGADYIPCVAFGKGAEFAGKYFHRGMRVTVSGHLQSGEYTNREGRKVYTLDLIVENQEFADGKESQRAPQNAPESRQSDFNTQTGNWSSNQFNAPTGQSGAFGGGFTPVEDEGLPWV